MYSPIQTDLVVAVRDQGYMFVTGPDVIKDVTGEDVSLDELGGADYQAKYGNIHQVVEDEKAAFQYVRDYLSFLPANTFDDAADRQPRPRARDHPARPRTRRDRAGLPTTRPTTCTRSCCGSSTTATSSRSPRRRARPSSPGTRASTGAPVGVIANQPMYNVGCDRQRGVRQGGPLRPVLRLVQHPAGVRRRHPGLHAGCRAGEGRHHQARRPVPVRRRRGRRARR